MHFLACLFAHVIVDKISLFFLLSYNQLTTYNHCLKLKKSLT